MNIYARVWSSDGWPELHSIKLLYQDNLLNLQYKNVPEGLVQINPKIG